MPTVPLPAARPAACGALAQENLPTTAETSSTKTALQIAPVRKRGVETKPHPQTFSSLI